MREREGYRPEQIRNEAFYHTRINNNQKKVLDVIRLRQPIDSERIAKQLGWYPHQVTPRVLELRQSGYITFAGEGTSAKSGKKVCLWKINNQGVQLRLEL